MDREFEMKIADRLLELIDSGNMAVTDDDEVELPVDEYLDAGRHEEDLRVLFGELPIMVALSAELPEPHDFKTVEVGGVPILVNRGTDGVVRAFINICRHRGCNAVEEERGASRRITCPYHGWVYDDTGQLVGMPGANTFPNLNREERGLVPLPAAEFHGAIWVIPGGRGGDIDLESFLGDFAEDVKTWGLEDLHWVGTRDHHVPANWMLCMDTFTESYHLPWLHRSSAGALSAGGVNLVRQVGHHHQMALPFLALVAMRDELPREEWQPFGGWGFALVNIIFPNAVVFLDTMHVEVFQVFPGDSATTSRVAHSFFTKMPFASEEERQVMNEGFDFSFDLVENEDFRMAAQVQRGLSTSVNKTFLLGRAEATTARLHSSYRSVLAEAKDADGGPVVPETPVAVR